MSAVPADFRAPVATVQAIFRYPVKSMRGEALESVALGWHGLVGDRRFAFLRSDSLEPHPWLTARQQARLIQYAPRFRDPADVEGSPVEVLTPDGRVLELQDPQLLDDVLGGSRFHGQLLHLGGGAFDSMPVSLIARQSVVSISEAIDADLDVRRFRPNLVLDLIDGAAYDETTWRGRTLRFGVGPRAARIRVDRLNLRCMVPGLDPSSATYDPAVLYYVTEQREQVAGVYGTPERTGEIRVGDSVYLLPERE
jgi:uncharacterized protein